MQAAQLHRRIRPVAFVSVAWLCLAMAAGWSGGLRAQTSSSPPGSSISGDAISVAGAGSAPIAIVPLDSNNAGSAAAVTGALRVTGGKALIAASGTVTSGTATTEVLLPHRGTLRVCASTTVKLAVDSSVPSGDIPGLMMALDHGAIETSFATGRNADILLTPDFRILIGGPGAADVKVRLGDHGDTCVDNPGLNAPYVLVTSVFDGSDYRVQAGQRVMFQHGSLHEVVDQEKEPCGCPAPAHPGSNEFPLAQSAGLAPLPAPAAAPSVQVGAKPDITEPLVYKSADHAPQSLAIAPPEPLAGANSSSLPETPHAPPKKSGFFRSIGRFFRRLFGGE